MHEAISPQKEPDWTEEYQQLSVQDDHLQGAQAAAVLHQATEASSADLARSIFWKSSNIIIGCT